MSEQHDIPIDVFSKGRSYGDVLTEYMRIWGDVNRMAISAGKAEDKAFSDTLAASAYRIYLLGVEDGMKDGDRA